MMTVIEKQYMNAVISIDRQMKDKTPNWEQRRYEIAKDILSAMFFHQKPSINRQEDISFAVKVADMLIKKLKEQKENE